MNRRRSAPVLAACALAALFLASSSPGRTDPVVDSPGVTSIDLLSSSKTVLDQPLRYPDGAPASVDAKLVTISPGGETGWHEHRTMMIGYVLSGRVTVEYRERESHVYEAGQVLLEALDWSHNGRNEGTEPVRILAFSMETPGTTPRTREEKRLH